MSKEELEEKIKNNETVYGVNYLTRKSIYDIELNSNYSVRDYFGEKVLLFADSSIKLINLIFSTKAEAQHYLDNSNVIRTDKLPFVTWEEFKRGASIEFTDTNGDKYVLNIVFVGIGLWKLNCCDDEHDQIDKDLIQKFDATEEGFYKAYETCKKLFLGAV